MKTFLLLSALGFALLLPQLSRADDRPPTSQPAASAPGSTPASASPARATVTAMTMTVRGFDRQVAAAHGYEIRTAPDGKQYSVRKNAALTATATPENVIGGNCGISYVYEYGRGNRAIELYTGYSVIHDVLRWNWQVRLDDRGGSSYRNYSGFINLGIWQDDRVIGGLTTGPARALVIPSNSWTILDTGSICHSGGPSDTTTIY